MISTLIVVLGLPLLILSGVLIAKVSPKYEVLANTIVGVTVLIVWLFSITCLLMGW